MEGREIPGFYYDREKKRYFAIRTNGSVASSSAYSSVDVKRRKIQDEKVEAAQAECERQRIRKSKYMNDALRGGLLEREFGEHELDVPQIVLGGYREAGKVARRLRMFNYENYEYDRSALFAVVDQPDLRQGHSEVDIFVACNDTLEMIRSSIDTEATGVITQFLYFGNSGETTSLNYNKGSQRIAMTWISPVATSGIAIVPWRTGGSSSNSASIIVTGPGYTMRDGFSVLSSTPAPPQSPLLFMFGGSSGMIISMDKGLNTVHVKNRSSPQDIFALEFLSDNPNVLLSGGRKGILDILDLRVPGGETEPDIIKHPSSITHIRQLDTHRIIVAGLNSSLCQYDLRFRKIHTSSASLRKLKSFENRATTISTLEYPAYYNTATTQIAFDVDPESQLVVAGQERVGGASMRFFSLFGGNELQSPNLNDVNGKWHSNEVVRCATFSKDTPNHLKSFYKMDGGKLYRYAWK